MSEIPNPALSPGFERARRLSGALSMILRISFWLTSLLLLAAPAVLLLPHALIFHYDRIAVHLAQGGFGDRALVALAVILFAIPLLFVLHQAQYVFANFRDGEVFAEPTIARIRSAAVWLMLAAVATTAGENLLDFASGSPPPWSDLKFSWLIFGAVAYVAAYVMAEGRRMANENAGFL